MRRYAKKYPSKWQSQYSEEFKNHVCQDFLTGDLTRRQIEHKYKLGNSRLTCWLSELGYHYSPSKFVPLSLMHTQKKPANTSDEVAKLTKQLEDAKLLAETYRRMIDKAECELNIRIVKKSNTK